MVLGWTSKDFLVKERNVAKTLNNQTREYSNIQILKKALFSMFPSYSLPHSDG